MKPIETARLQLRKLTHDDAAFIVALVNEPAFIANIGNKHARDIEGAIRYLDAGPLASYARHGHGLLHVSLKDGGEAIGICGLLKRDGLDDADVGFALLQQHWGQGYAAEAAAACLTDGYGRLGLPRIVGITKPDNIGSQRVLEKIGLVFERMVQLPGMPDGDCLYVPVAR
jgi:RimJ/RimL family protein N-acetyltransferase